MKLIFLKNKKKIQKQNFLSGINKFINNFFKKKN